MVVVTGDVHGKATVSLALMLPYLPQKYLIEGKFPKVLYMILWYDSAFRNWIFIFNINHGVKDGDRVSILFLMKNRIPFFNARFILGFIFFYITCVLKHVPDFGWPLLWVNQTDNLIRMKLFFKLSNYELQKTWCILTSQQEGGTLKKSGIWPRRYILMICSINV